MRIPIKAIVLPKVTRQLPFEIPNSNELQALDLTDPTFNKSSQIDLILGNDYEYLVNIEGIKRNICGRTSACSTIFGWVLSGLMKTQTVQTLTISVIPLDISDLNNILKKFWAEEQIPSTHPCSTEDEICERFYTRTIRHENGRYIFRLPFREEYPEKFFLGSSRFIALAQYSGMEKTLSKNSEL